MVRASIIAAVVAAAALSAASAAWAGKRDSVVLIRNQSAWDIHQLYLSPTEDDDWGPDQLGEHIIPSGSTFKLYKIPCNQYDVRLVDEDGDPCVVGGVTLCGKDDAWVISDDDLLACQAATQD